MSSSDAGAFAAALRLISHRDFSSGLLRERLERKGFSATEAAAAAARCEEYGYVDDHDYGLNRARELLRRKPSGTRGLLHDLRGQRLAPTMSEQIATEIYAELGGEGAVLDDALQRWIGAHGEPSTWQSVRRCSSHLARRGFATAAVHAAMSPWLDELGS